MSGLDEMKQSWNAQTASEMNAPVYDAHALQDLVKKRTKKQMNTAMQYFWASFVLQNIVYALLANVAIRFWNQPDTLWLAVAGIMLYIPFTIMLIKKFKRMATVRHAMGGPESLHKYIAAQYLLLNSFLKFKKSYECILIPVSSAIGVWLVFKLYVPGGVASHMAGAFITFALTLLSCTVAIVAENKRNFRDPLNELNQMLKEFEG